VRGDGWVFCGKGVTFSVRNEGCVGRGGGGPGSVSPATTGGGRWGGGASPRTADMSIYLTPPLPRSPAPSTLRTQARQSERDLPFFSGVSFRLKLQKHQLTAFTEERWLIYYGEKWACCSILSDLARDRMGIQLVRVLSSLAR
jgi:hypothetical protein